MLLYNESTEEEIIFQPAHGITEFYDHSFISVWWQFLLEVVAGGYYLSMLNGSCGSAHQPKKITKPTERVIIKGMKPCTIFQLATPEISPARPQISYHHLLHSSVSLPVTRGQIAVTHANYARDVRAAVIGACIIKCLAMH